MATLTNPMKEMISQQLPFLATVTDAETLRPNLGPKRSLRVWDDHTLVYNENTGRQHYENLLEAHWPPSQLWTRLNSMGTGLSVLQKSTAPGRCGTRALLMRRLTVTPHPRQVF